MPRLTTQRRAPFGTPLGNSNVCAAFAELAPHMPALKWAHLSRRRLRLDAFALILPVVNASRKVFSLDTSTLHACCTQHTVDMNMCIEGRSLMVALPLCDVVDSSSITAELSCDPSCTRSALHPGSILSIGFSFLQPNQVTRHSIQE